MSHLASTTTGSNRVVNRGRCNIIPPNVDFELLQTHLEDILHRKTASLISRQFGPLLFFTINFSRENGK